jgi:hypothetical protein
MYGPFVLFLSVIMLYVLLRFTDSDYAFGILNSSFIYIVVASFIGGENRRTRGTYPWSCVTQMLVTVNQVMMATVRL